jgi:hypothetical protein
MAKMTLSMISDLAGPAEVINLDRRVDRWEQSSAHLTTLKIAFQRFPAVDGSKLPNSDPRVVNQIGFGHPESSWKSPDLPNKKARVGCSLSHYAVVEKAKKERRKCVLILEDDARFSEIVTEISQIRDNFIAAWGCLPKDCDILMLGANHLTQRGYLPKIVNECFVRCTGAIGGHAYIVFERYYDRFLAIFQENFSRIGNADGTGGIVAQDSLLRSVQANDHHYALNPLIATQAPGESNIILDAHGLPKVVDYTSKLHHLETFLPVSEELQFLLPNNTIEEVWDLSHKGRSSCKIYKIIYKSENGRQQGIIKLFPARKESVCRVEKEAREELEQMKLENIIPVADLNPGNYGLTLAGEHYTATIQSYAEGLNFDDLLRQKTLYRDHYKKFGEALATLACDGKQTSELMRNELPEPNRERVYARDILGKIADIGSTLLEKEDELYRRMQTSTGPIYGSHEHGDPHGGNFFIHAKGITPIDLSGRHRTRGATGVMGNELYNALHAIVGYGLRYGHTLENLTLLQKSFYDGYTQRLSKQGIVISREAEEYYSFVWSGFLLYHAGLKNAGEGWDTTRLVQPLSNELLVRSEANSALKLEIC